MSRTATGPWTERTVAWYERANARSDYAACVLGAIASDIDGCHTALDVGAGFGALTLPLAQRMRHVTALEPSPAMAAGLRRAAARAGMRNVTRAPSSSSTTPAATTSSSSPSSTPCFLGFRTGANAISTRRCASSPPSA